MSDDKAAWAARGNEIAVQAGSVLLKEAKGDAALAIYSAMLAARLIAEFAEEHGGLAAWTTGRNAYLEIADAIADIKISEKPRFQ